MTVVNPQMLRVLTALREEDSRAVQLEQEDDMTTSDAQGVASAETYVKYGKSATDLLLALSPAESNRVLKIREREIVNA